MLNTIFQIISFFNQITVIFSSFVNPIFVVYIYIKSIVNLFTSYLCIIPDFKILLSSYYQLLSFHSQSTQTQPNLTYPSFSSSGQNASGQDVFLRDIWPTKNEILAVEKSHVLPSMFKEVYARIEVTLQ